MEESEFRHALGRRWASLFDKAIILRASRLAGDGAYVEAHWQPDVDADSVVVTGIPNSDNADRPIPTIEAGKVDGSIHLEAHCSCGQAACVHAAALTLGILGLTGRRIALHAPRKPRPAVVERNLPTAVLLLRAVNMRSNLNGSIVVQALGVARLGFDYHGIRVKVSTDVRHADDIDERPGVERNRAAEFAAVESLESLGFVDIDMLPTLRGVAASAFQRGDFVVEAARRTIASAEQILVLTPRLRELGFRIESEADFPYELIEEPDGWYAEVDDNHGHWFDLSLGIDIDGERVDLLPILRKLLSDAHFPLRPRRGEPADATWLVPLDARRRIPLSLARLRQLIAPLLEWLGRPAGARDGPKLRLRRAQAGVLEDIDSATELPWIGAEQLRRDLATLRDQHQAATEPPGFLAQLRPYQREGLAWLGFLADAGLGGILADDMGLGKTVQVLAHLLAEKQRGRLAQPVLIVAPTSLVGNWRDESRRFAPDLHVLVLHGPARAGLHEQIPRHDLIITTYPLLSRDRDELLTHAYSLLVLDESQAIKNPKSLAAKVVREIPARRRLAMTGTPLENHLGELWAQFDAVESSLLGTETQFAKFYRTPIEKHADDERRERLGRRIAPLLLRRRKRDVLDDLPDKTEIIQQVELDGGQRSLYESLRLAQHERVRDEVGKRGLAQSGIVVLDALLKLRQACCDPRLVKLDNARGISESAKLDALLEIVDNLVAEGRRALIFSQFAEMLALIAQALDARKHRYLTLTGATPGVQRAALVKRYQAGEVPLFLISLKAGGTGLNLTAADTVIHYDPWWNPAVEAQATDRAHRIGQTRAVFVYKLICAGTVEEKIQALQQRKAELAASILEGNGSTQNLRFDEADLAELFAPLEP